MKHYIPCIPGSKKSSLFLLFPYFYIFYLLDGSYLWQLFFRPDISTPRLGRRRKSRVNYDKFPPQQSNHQIVSYSDAHDSGTSSPPRPSFRNGTKRARSPVPSVDGLATSSIQSDSERYSLPFCLPWLSSGK